MPATGKITQVIGSTFDAEFPEHELPKIYNAVKVDFEDKAYPIHLVGEVEQHLGGGKVRAVALGSTEGILPEDLPESVLPTGDTPDDVVPRFHRALVEARREMILKAYREACGDPALAAAVLGLHPNSLLGLVRRLDLQPAIDLLSGEE